MSWQVVIVIVVIVICLAEVITASLVFQSRAPQKRDETKPPKWLPPVN